MTADLEQYPRVSVVIACRNEADTIARCLDSILANTYPMDRIEVLVVDGGSSDRTREVVSAYTERFPNVVLEDNPREIAAAGWNIGIRKAHGEAIFIVSAHTTLERTYIERSVSALSTHQADDVGGILRIRPRDEHLFSKIMAWFYSHPFGVGNASYRFNATKAKAVDTVHGGCYRRDVFDRVGFFDENLRRSVDNEFNQRLRNAGGLIMMDPSVVSYYFARASLGGFLRKNFVDGEWGFLPALFGKGLPIGIRHVVPMGFVGALVCTLVVGRLWSPALWLNAAIVVTYAFSAFLASAQIALRERSLVAFVALPALFAGAHIGYGLGSWWGAALVAISILRGSDRQRSSVSA